MHVTKQYLWGLGQFLAALLLVAAGAAVIIRTAMALYDGYAIAWSYEGTPLMAYKTLALGALGVGLLVLMVVVAWMSYWLVARAADRFAYGHYLANGGNPQWFRHWQHDPDLYARLAFSAVTNVVRLPD